MCNMVRDKRLQNIHSIETEDNIFEVLHPQESLDEKLYVFTSPVDHIMGGMLDHRLRNSEEEKAVISDLEENLTPFKNSPWEYAEQINRIYGTCNLTTPVFEQCIRVMKTNENKWFEWLASIPYAGIQSIFLHYSQSIQCLISFIRYLQQHQEETKQRDYLIALVILELNNKLLQIDRNIEFENHSWQKRFEWNVFKWEDEADNYITDFTSILFQLPKEQLHRLLFTMLSHLWVYNARRNKFENKIRNKILEKLVTQLQKEEDIKAFLLNSNWHSSKSTLLHKLLIYVQWTIEQNKKNNVCAELLWQQAIACLETKKTYFYYEQPDEQTFSWVFAKLLADEPDPLKKITIILKRYRQRFGVWCRDYEQVFQMQRARYFFLTVGAMATEWLLREKNYDMANYIIRFIFKESQLVTDDLPEHTADELNFLQQFWARYALFQTYETSMEDAKLMLTTLDSITTIDYRLIAITVFLKNLAPKNKGPWFNELFAKNILTIIDKDMRFLDYWPQTLARDVKNHKEKGKEIKKLIATCSNLQ